MAGLLDWVDPAREWWQTRPEVAKGLLGAVYQLATDPAARESAMARAPKPFDMSPEALDRDRAMVEGFWNPAGLLGVLSPGKYQVFHGTRATKKWYDLPEYKAMMEAGNDIPKNVASSTYPIAELKGSLGGLKMMDGLGPHAGTAEAANERLAKVVGVSPREAFSGSLLPGSTKQRGVERALEDAYIMPMVADVKKPFGPKNADAYTETQLQSRLSEMAKKMGFNDTRAYSSAYGASGNMKSAQKAVRDKLREEGYDAIPYINSHEDRGSISWVFLDPSILKSGLLGK